MTATTVRRIAPAFLLFSLAVTLRLAYVSAYPQLALQADSLDYDRLARSVLASEGLVDPHGEPETLRAPLYPLFVAGVYWITTPDAQQVRVIQAVLGALSPLLVLGLGRMCFSPRVAWSAAIICAAYPALVAYSGLLLTETLAGLLVTAVAVTASLASRKQTPEWSAITGLAAGATSLCRAEFTAVAVALCLATLVVPPGALNRRLRSALIMLGVFLLTLLPWTMRNYRALGSVVPLTTDGWRTLWIASYPERWLEWRAAEPLLSIEAGATGPLERSRRFRAAALDNLRSHPGTYLKLVVQRLPLLLIGGHSNVIVGLEVATAESSGLRRLIKIGMLTVNTFLIAAAGLGMWLCRRSWKILFPLYLIILVPALTYALLFAVPRYHLPLLPIGFLFAAEACQRLMAARHP